VVTSACFLRACWLCLVTNSAFVWITSFSVGRTVRGSNPGRDRVFFSPSERPDRLWGTPSFLFSPYRRSLPGVKREVPTNLRLGLRLRIYGAIPLLPLYAFMTCRGKTLSFTASRGGLYSRESRFNVYSNSYHKSRKTA